MHLRALWLPVFFMASVVHLNCAVIYRTYKARVESEFAQGIQDFNRGKLFEAADHFETVVSIDPEYPQGEYYRRTTEMILFTRRNNYYNLAVEQQKRGMVIEALINLHQSEKHNGDRAYKDTPARIQTLLQHPSVLKELDECDKRGRSLAQQGNHAAARLQFQRALAIHPTSPEAKTNLYRTHDALKRIADTPFQEGMAAMKQDHPDLALAKFQRTLQIFPEYPGADQKVIEAVAAVNNQRYYQMAMGSSQQGNHPLALEYFSYMSAGYKNSALARSQSLDVIRSNVEQYFKQAVSYYESQRLNESYMLFKWIVVAAPDHDEARKYLELAKKKMDTLRKIEAE